MITLNNFIKSVPICEERDLQQLGLWQNNQITEFDQIIIVDEHYIPFGIISNLFLISKVVKSLTNNLSTSESSLILEQFIEPITVISESLELKNFLLNIFSKNHQKNYILVNSEEKVIGFIDNNKLIQYCHSSYQSLLRLLEYLPIPLIWQTDANLTENITWDQQIGNLLSPQDLITQFNQTENIQVNHQQNPANLVNIPHQPDCLKDTYYPQQKQPLGQLSIFLSDQDKLKSSAFTQIIKPVSEIVQTFKNLQIKPVDNYSLWENNISNISESEIFEQEKLIRIKDHIWQFKKLSLKRLHHNRYYLILANNITKQQINDKQLLAKNSNLIQLNHLKNDFLTVLSHQLKSPITSIVGLASLLQEQKLGLLNEKQSSYTKLIYESGRQLMSLVNTVLDLTYLQTGQLKLNLEPISIANICEEVFELIQFKHPHNYQLNLTLQINYNLEQIIADELRLRQMLTYLLEQKIKSIQAQGTIKLIVNSWANWLTFTISDNLQISQQQSQLEIQENGLEIIVTTALAQAHGGDISFVSQVDHSNEFTLLLPNNSINKLNHNLNPIALIIESIPNQIQNLTTKVKSLNYQVIIARSGTEALTKARLLQPKVIFLNPLIPYLSGWDVLMLLKSDPKTQNIPIIITSKLDDQQKSLEYGADHFLTFPIQTSDLQKILISDSETITYHQKILTILHLYPEPDKISWFASMIKEKTTFDSKNCLSALSFRILEADDLEQAELLSKVWHIDLIVLDGHNLINPQSYLLALSECEYLASFPLITLDIQTTQAANQIDGLSVFPCLIPQQQENWHSLLQIIEIAVGLNLN